MSNVKNFAEQGGEKTVIGGEIVITGKIKAEAGATVEGFPTGEPYVLPAATASALGGVKLAAAQADSTAAELADLLADFNALLSKLRAAGIVANS